MKLTVPSIQNFLLIAVFCLMQTSTFSQISVASTTGYSVNIDVTPIAVNPASNSCDYGFNYTIKMRYNISITGNNAPSSLYTLQGTIGCGSTASFFDLPNGRGNGTVNSSNAWTSAKNCGTVTVSSLGCTTVNIQIEGPGISSRVVSFAAAQSALSIKLTSFTAVVEKSAVKLNWATATETNNEFFSIERSADGIEWKEVKRVAGAGNSEFTRNYESVDESPVAGNSYYRLKQTDFDGQKSYSDVQLVKFVPCSKRDLFVPCSECR